MIRKEDYFPFITKYIQHNKLNGSARKIWNSLPLHVQSHIVEIGKISQLPLLVEFKKNRYKYIYQCYVCYLLGADLIEFNCLYSDASYKSRFK